MNLFALGQEMQWGPHMQEVISRNLCKAGPFNSETGVIPIFTQHFAFRIYSPFFHKGLSRLGFGPSDRHHYK